MAKGLRSKSKLRDKRIYRQKVTKPNADRINNEMHERCLAAAKAQDAAKAAAAAIDTPIPAANGTTPREPVKAERYTGQSGPRKQVVRYAVRTQNNPKKRYYNMHKHLVSKTSKRTGGPSRWTK